MIDIDFNKKTYTCPFCGRQQAFYNMTRIMSVDDGLYFSNACYNHQIDIYYLRCANNACEELTIVALDTLMHKQIDLYPQNVYRHYPDYIPQAIREDYEEASLIIDKSPKAAATLLRRCLQGMIRDYWQVKPGRLCDEISAIQGRVTASQWAAIDGLRQIGNIGAHMEKDVNLIIDIEPDEATKLQRLIELLLGKWYISRHDEEELCKDITSIADDKKSQK